MSALAPAPEPAQGTDVPLPTEDSVRRSARTMLRSMVEEMDDAELEVLVDFLESESAGALFLAREGGRIVIGAT